MNKYNYGYIFNDISISNNIFSKKYKNEYGKIKINYEIDFYIFILSNKILFKLPNLLNYEDGHLEIEYINNSQTLTKIVNKNNVDFFLKLIKNHLNELHFFKINIDKTRLITDLNIELEEKIIKRFYEFNWESDNIYNSIKSVNGIKIKNIFYYTEIIKNSLCDLLYDRSYYNLIHGDVHLGNILIDSKKELYFIDPRGYFGETKLFGILEYDYAKLMNGLSGYSIFNEMEFNNIEINNSNLEIDFIEEYQYIFETNRFDRITTLLCLSIWLGNNSCFTDVNKKIISIMIAYYYCEKYL
jgi:hypothetical protein